VFIDVLFFVFKRFEICFPLHLLSKVVAPPLEFNSCFAVSLKNTYTQSEQAERFFHPMDRKACSLIDPLVRSMHDNATEHCQIKEFVYIPHDFVCQQLQT
jgi:hypothetical protein